MTRRWQRSNRQPVGALLAFAMLIVAGCQPQATVGPAASPKPASPRIPSPAASAGAELDTDLAPADQAAIEDLLASDELSAYMPTELIHDGGVLLFRTQGAPTPAASAETAAGDAPPAPAPAAAPPAVWRRMEGKRGDRQGWFRRKPDTGVHVRASIGFPVQGILAYRDPAGGRVVRKPFADRQVRAFEFERADNRWRLSAVSPIEIEALGGRSGLSFPSVRLFSGVQTAARFTYLDGAGPIRPADLAVFAPGGTLRIEAELKQETAEAVFVFAHLVGQDDRSRQQLFDNGQDGDRAAGDGIFTGRFVLPATPGLRHVAIDALDARTFEAGGVYRAHGLGLTFHVR